MQEVMNPSLPGTGFGYIDCITEIELTNTPLFLLFLLQWYATRPPRSLALQQLTWDLPPLLSSQHPWEVG